MISTKLQIDCQAPSLKVNPVSMNGHLKKYKEFCLHENPSMQINSILSDYQDNLNTNNNLFYCDRKAPKEKASNKTFAISTSRRIAAQYLMTYSIIMIQAELTRDKRFEHVNDESSSWDIHNQKYVWKPYVNI
ncbi:hypothetical protein AB4K20DRAFT_2012621 [Rhizopus microsporus]|uniref:Uncharacterized protein n=1 Tax=Rhizopus microsporus TaxID=58291 RepID=A0A1X0RME5_RHIZD|nr:hypothetical protein BCV71DRAFT_239521 [Rhizopus microsporus]